MTADDKQVCFNRHELYLQSDSFRQSVKEKIQKSTRLTLYKTKLFMDNNNQQCRLVSSVGKKPSNSFQSISQQTNSLVKQNKAS